MNNRWFLALWICIPAFVLAWHYGPGQTYLHRDNAASHLTDARAAAADGDWQTVYTSLNSAELALPKTDAIRKQELQFAAAAARIKAGQILEGIEQLQTMLDDSGDEKKEELYSEQFKDRIRNELASAAYHAGWIMRVEGATEDEWKPEVERARQHFRMLAEKSKDKGDEKTADKFTKNLEATIRMEHMDLKDLMALPFPKNCPKCNGSLSQKKRKQRMSKGKKEGKEGESDARQKIQEQKKGAGHSPREGSGS